MCTVSWLRTARGYELFCNRDELHTRGRALPPRAQQRNGVRFLAPHDPDGGGAWIGVNQFGLSLCLLNGASAAQDKPPADFISRGLLLRELIDSAAPEAMAGRLRALPLSRFRPFTLLALGPSAQMLWRWSGSALTSVAQHEMPPFLTSSSFDPMGVAAARRAEFDRLRAAYKGATPEMLLAFHRAHGEERGPYSTCLHRTDAQTVSFSRIAVHAKQIAFTYTPAAPCAHVARLTVRLLLDR